MLQEVAGACQAFILHLNLLNELQAAIHDLEDNKNVADAERESPPVFSRVRMNFLRFDDSILTVEVPLTLKILKPALLAASDNVSESLQRLAQLSPEAASQMRKEIERGRVKSPAAPASS